MDYWVIVSKWEKKNWKGQRNYVCLQHLYSQKWFWLFPCVQPWQQLCIITYWLSHTQSLLCRAISLHIQLAAAFSFSIYSNKKAHENNPIGCSQGIHVCAPMFQIKVETAEIWIHPYSNYLNTPIGPVKEEEYPLQSQPHTVSVKIHPRRILYMKTHTHKAHLSVHICDH